MTSQKSATASEPPSASADSKVKGSLGLALLVALVVGSTIGSGIFGLPQNMAAGAGAGAILIGWAVTGVGMLMLALVYQRLALRKPRTRQWRVCVCPSPVGRICRLQLGLGLLDQRMDRQCRVSGGRFRGSWLLLSGLWRGEHTEFDHWRFGHIYGSCTSWFCAESRAQRCSTPQSPSPRSCRWCFLSWWPWPSRSTPSVSIFGETRGLARCLTRSKVRCS